MAGQRPSTRSTCAESGMWQPGRSGGASLREPLTPAPNARHADLRAAAVLALGPVVHLRWRGARAPHGWPEREWLRGCCGV